MNKLNTIAIIIYNRDYTEKANSFIQEDTYGNKLVAYKYFFIVAILTHEASMFSEL